MRRMIGIRGTVASQWCRSVLHALRENEFSRRAWLASVFGSCANDRVRPHAPQRTIATTSFSAASRSSCASGGSRGRIRSSQRSARRCRSRAPRRAAATVPAASFDRPLANVSVRWVSSRLGGSVPKQFVVANASVCR